LALDLGCKGKRPMVIAGAMLERAVAGADGPTILLALTIVAASSNWVGVGSLVVMGDQIDPAR
jgi:L-asparaginase/Glu-tRNA(Gln) amidotransferase subunit D